MSAKWRCSLAWRRGPMPPPEGMSRVLLSVLCDAAHPVPAEIYAKWLEMGPGSGWSVGWELIEQRPIRRWSAEAKGRVRRQRLRRRIEKRFPLFAEIFIADDLARRPQYFRGEA